MPKPIKSASLGERYITRSYEQTRSRLADRDNVQSNATMGFSLGIEKIKYFQQTNR